MNMLKKYLLSNVCRDAVGAELGSASALFAGGRINVLAQRPYVDENDETRIVVNTGDGYSSIVTNAVGLLQYQEWLEIDRTVIEVAKRRLVAISDLQARGLTHPLGSIGVTVSLWDRSSDMTPAVASMSGVTVGEEDTPAYQTASVPVPIIHKDFRVNLRRLEASRRFGEAIDVTASSIAARLVAEKSEQMLFAGLPITVEGGTIYGYTNHPDRNQVSMATPWPSITQANNNLIIADILASQQASRNQQHFGPWIIYIPTSYEAKLDEDYRSLDARTLRQRILAIAGIVDIKVADFLTGDNVLFVEMDRQTVDLAMAQDVTTVQWSEMGGMQQLFKVMAVWVPRIKSDYDGRCGISHLRP